MIRRRLRREAKKGGSKDRGVRKELVIFDPASDGLRRVLNSHIKTPIQKWFSGLLIPEQQVLVQVARARAQKTTTRAWIGGTGDDFQNTRNRRGEVVVA